MKILVLFLAPMTLLLSWPMREAMDGVCERVIDGDTIEVRTHERHYRVRLLGIDAPEKNQLNRHGVAIGEISKEHLRIWIESKHVDIAIYGQDQYGRLIGMARENGCDIGERMLREGLAVLYPYAEFPDLRDKFRYVAALEMAQWERRGLWGEGGIPDPGRFRSRERKRAWTRSLGQH